MQATVRPGNESVGYRPRRGSEDSSQFLGRWMKVFIALLVVVTLVAVAYLVAITTSLAAINGNLAVARNAVTGAGGHTKTLPDQVQGINASLAAIDPALKPVPGQADQIISALTSIDSKLKVTVGSLSNTSGSLQSTSSQLVDTSSILQTVLGQAGTIKDTLAAADRPVGDCGPTSCGADQLGVQNIHQRVNIANNILTPARVDADNILSGLGDVNKHLTSVCRLASLRTAPC